GEVRVSGSQADTRLDPAGTQVKAQDLERFNRDNVSQAISLLPGVSYTTNMRNEQPISVRGFDGRRTPLFLDGVPVYVPYDGQVDFSRFLTFDLAEIEVAKG
uniref:TonB-dependent receptor plug domain-containing protein n=1 Tax=Salmonella enterica TaxID=28901 RepID=UPI003FA6FAD0